MPTSDSWTPHNLGIRCSLYPSGHDGTCSRLVLLPLSSWPCCCCATPWVSALSLSLLCCMLVHERCTMMHAAAAAAVCVCVCVCACVRLPTGRVRADSAPEAGDHSHPQLSGTARCGQCWSWRGCRCWRWCVEWTRQAFHHGSRTRQVPRVAQRAEASAAAHEELVGGGATKGAQHHVSHFTYGVHTVARPMHHGD